MNALYSRFKNLSPDLSRFFAATFLFGLASSFSDAVFNNFLHERFTASAWDRMFLEFPREVPGLLTVLFAAALFFIGSRSRAAVALAICAVGMLLLGTWSLSYPLMLLWLFIFSVGQHLWLPLASSIGMELAGKSGDGRRLGQLNALRNLAAIVGAGLITLAFGLFPLPLEAGFWAAALGFAAGAFFLARLSPDRPVVTRVYWNFPPQYRLYYLLTVLYGSRKQIFLTFAPWVLVSVLGQPVMVVGGLLTLGGALGIIFQPFLGRAIDRWGEKTVLALEAALLVAVCLAYGLGPLFLPPPWALIVAGTCFVCDLLLMSVNMARATYLKKIALSPEDVTPTLTMGVSIDHVFSISVALLGGLIWVAFGFTWVFILGSLIALANLAAALRMKSPASQGSGRVVEIGTAPLADD